jgi:transposase
MNNSEQQSDEYLVFSTAFNVLNKQNEVLKALNSSQAVLVQNQESRITNLEEQNAWLKKQIFGQKSERYIDDSGEEAVLPGLELSEVPSIPKEKEHIEYDRNKKKNKGSCTLKIPDDIEVVEIIKELPPDQRYHPKTGEELVEIGRETVDKLAVYPGKFYIKRFVYVKYAVPGNSLAGITQMPAEDSILKGSKFDESFMAYVVSEKLCYHTPFYRQHEKLQFDNIEIDRRTLSNLAKNIGTKLDPLYAEMKKAVFNQGYIHTDDTPIKMLVPGNGKTKETRMWVYEGANPNAPPYKIYEFTETRQYKHPKKFLNGFKGIIHADAYGAYVDIDADKHIPILWSACWAHARRKIFDSTAGNRELKRSLLRLIRALFRYERIAWKYNANIRMDIRKKCEAPIVDAIFEIIKEKFRTEIMLPKENLTKAVNYLLNYEANFRIYLTDPNIKMDNNAALSLSINYSEHWHEAT